MVNEKVMVMCEECGKKTYIDKLSILQREGLFNDNKSLFVTYYTCPHCDKIHHVAVDDTETLELMRIFKDSIVRAGKQRETRGKVKSETIRIVNRNQKKVERARNALNIGYSDSVYQYQGKEYKLELCVPNTTN